MSTVVWVAIGAGSFFCIAVVTALTLAHGLRAVARHASKLVEEEAWATAPPTRATNVLAPEHPTQPVREANVIRLRASPDGRRHGVRARNQ